MLLRASRVLFFVLFFALFEGLSRKEEIFVATIRVVTNADA